jgi:hypothetical protein
MVRNTSSKLNADVMRISASVFTETGLGLVALVVGMRDPVTTTVSTLSV